MTNQGPNRQPSTGASSVSEQGAGLSGAKFAVTQLVYLLASRRRQAQVISLPWILLLLGVAFEAGALTGAAVDQGVLGLVTLLLGAVAAALAWREYRYGPPEPAMARYVVLAGGVLLPLGAVAMLLGVNLVALWAAGLIVVAVALLRLDRAATS